MIILDCMDLNLALMIERPANLTNKSFIEDKYDLEKWDYSNLYESYDHKV